MRKNLKKLNSPSDDEEEEDEADNNIESSSTPSKKMGFGHRHIQILFIFACLTFSIAMRANFSIAIVAMTDNSTSVNPDIPTFHWNNTSVILSSFFWSYVILQVFAGYISKKYGAKYMILSCSIVNTAAFTLIPLGAQWMGSTGVIILRVLQGLAQGTLFPCAHTVLGIWAPEEERSTLGILIYSGISCGSILAFSVTGYVCSSRLGWPFSFYIFSVFGSAWCILFAIFGHNSPSTHPSIKEEEKDYIEKSLGTSEQDDKLSIPWKSILSCGPFWAIVAANIGSAWGYTMLMTQIPTYLAKVMKFDISSNGLVSAVPYVAGAIFGFVFAPLSDCLIKKNLLRTITARRIFQLVGAYGLVACLMLLAYIANTKVLTVVLLALGNVAYSSTLVGYSVNHVDLSPRFAGIMQGISNCISQVFAMFSPLIVHFLVEKPTESSQWRFVFIIASAFYFICATIFAIFSSATRQKWDSTEARIRHFVSRIHDQRRITVISTLHSIPGYE